MVKEFEWKDEWTTIWTERFAESQVSIQFSPIQVGQCLEFYEHNGLQIVEQDKTTSCFLLLSFIPRARPRSFPFERPSSSRTGKDAAWADLNKIEEISDETLRIFSDSFHITNSRIRIFHSKNRCWLCVSKFSVSSCIIHSHRRRFSLKKCMSFIGQQNVLGMQHWNDLFSRTHTDFRLWSKLFPTEISKE